jgi:ankyrin repeat protein
MSIALKWRSLVAVALVFVLGGAVGRDDSPVIEAAKAAKWAALRTLVEQGADVTVAAPDGATALHWASLHADVESVELLLRAGADANAANDLGATPIWAAGQSGDVTVMERLLAAGADPNKALRHGETPLMSTVRSGNPAAVEILLEHGADPDSTGPREQTALMWAAANRYSDIVGALVRHGADVNARSEESRQLKAHEPHPHPEHQIWVTQGGNTALMFAARVGDVSSARHLVGAGADVNTRDGWGISALTMAVYSDFGTVVIEPFFAPGGPVHVGGSEELREGQFAELVEFLLEEGADPNLGAEKFTALHAAIMRREGATVDRLLEHGADPNAPLGTITPIQRGSNSAFYFHRAWVGATPFWLAARFATPVILHSLAEHGADPLFLHRGVHYPGTGALGGGIFADRVEEVTTPLMAAVGMSETGRAWVYQWLSSAEHEAEVLEKVELMLSLGVDQHAVSDDGRTALEHAETMGYDSVVDLLVQTAAKEDEPAPWR